MDEVDVKWLKHVDKVVEGFKKESSNDAEALEKCELMLNITDLESFKKAYFR